MDTRTLYDYNEKEIDNVKIYFLQKNIKRMSLRVKPDGKVIAVRPLLATLEESIKFAYDNIDWIRRTQQKILQKATEKKPKMPFTLAEINTFKAKLGQIFPHCEARMKLYASKVTIRQMKTRWGSCSSCGNISINLELARYSDECLEYVIIHELAHLVHRNHSDNFWQLVATYCPDWKRIRHSLRY